MDLFSDIITQRRSPRKTVNVGESSSEARENRENRIKVAAYEQAIEEYQALIGECEKTLAEIRRLSLKCVETNEATNQLVQAGVEKFDTFEPAQVKEDYVPTAAGASEASVEELKNIINSSMAGLNCYLDESLGSIKSDISEISGNVDNSIGSLRTEFAGMAGNVDETLGSIKSEFAGITGNVDNSISSLKSELSGISGNIDASLESLKAGVSAGANDVLVESISSNIGNNLSEVKSDIALTMSNVKAGVDSSMDSLKSDMDSAMEAFAADMSGKIADQENYIHKENIRVYRNVQAALVDELKQQTEALSQQNSKLEKKLKGSKAVSIIALVFSAITMVGVLGGLAMDIFGIALHF